MRVYVAANFKEKARARALMDLLERHGHNITHDWTRENAGDLQGEALAAFRTARAREDVCGVLLAEVLVILVHENGSGMFTELGVALAREIPVVAVDTHLNRNIFLHLARVHARDDADVLRCLATL